MIVRDSDGIIVQHKIHDPSYQDGGDSAHRTGIMSLCGSLQDQYNLPMFNERGLVVRHPEQGVYDDPRSTSRDQLVPYMAGLYEAGMYKIAEGVALKCRNRGWYAQNVLTLGLTEKPWYMGPDVLMPDVQNHMLDCARMPVTKWGRRVGDAWLLASLVWSTKIKPWDEQNNIICMCIIRGKEWVHRYVSMHPDYIKATTDYWCSWRDQPEIASELLKRIDKELMR